MTFNINAMAAVGGALVAVSRGQNPLKGALYGFLFAQGAGMLISATLQKGLVEGTEKVILAQTGAPMQPNTTYTLT